MRSSISAQSWLSVPPAPALMVKMAGARSCCPPASSGTRRPPRSPRGPRVRPGGPSPRPRPATFHSTSTLASSSWVFRRFRSSRSPSRRLPRLWTFCASAWFDQNSGAVMRASSAWSSSFSRASSKIAADVRGPRDEVFQLLSGFVGQSIPPYERLGTPRHASTPSSYDPKAPARDRLASSSPVSTALAPRAAPANTSPWRE